MTWITLVRLVDEARGEAKAISIAFQGNIVDVWEQFAERGIKVDLGSDQTSLHNPWAGGYYPAGISFEESNFLMVSEAAEIQGSGQGIFKKAGKCH